MLFSPIGRYVLGVLAVLAAIGAFYWFAYSDGQEAVAKKQDKQSLKVLRERGSHDQEVDALPAAELDARFGRWVQPD